MTRAIRSIEVTDLEKICRMLEDEVYADTGLRGMNGAFAVAKVTDINDGDAVIGVEWGQQDSGEDFINKDVFIIDRDILDDDSLVLEEKFKHVNKSYSARC